MREKQALMERRNQEREQATKKRGTFKFFSRSSKSFEEEDTKKELEAKTKAKKIDLKALEESRRQKARQSTDKQQKDFRHVLRQTDPSKAKKTPRSVERDSKGKDETEVKKNLLKPPLRIEDKKKGRGVSSEATELTGSWDYIPSEPSSTVDLLANTLEDHIQSYQVHTSPERERVPASHQPMEYYEDSSTTTPREYSPPHDSMEQAEHYTIQQQPGSEHSRESSRDMGSSSPVLNLSAAAKISADGEMDWNRKERMPNHDFDYETQL